MPAQMIWRTLVNRRLTPPEASDLLGIPLRTLVDWRYRSRGPATYKLGGRWFYDSDACEEWRARQRQGSLRGDDVPVTPSAGLAVVPTATGQGATS